MKLTAPVITMLISFAAAAHPTASSVPKSYAVFLATLDLATGQASGGVAGSAFFVSPTEAITAFHVLQPASFKNANTQIWLVHEGEEAIELSLQELTSVADLDKTTINLKSVRAPARNVYERAHASTLPVGAKLETDGFLANSTGPHLELSAAGPHPRLRITSVPKLERLHAEGSLMRSVRIELSSTDLNLKNAPCVQVSYKPVVGLSGGPVSSAGRVIGMNSFAEPNGRQSTFAVEIATDSQPN